MWTGYCRQIIVEMCVAGARNVSEPVCFVAGIRLGYSKPAINNNMIGIRKALG